MPIDASIISQARNIPQIRYQPESQFESFAKIQPTLNAMRQMRQEQMQTQQSMAEQQALQEIRQRGYDPEEIGTLLQMHGKTQAQMELGVKMVNAARAGRADQRPSVVGPGSALISHEGKELYKAPPVERAEPPGPELVQLMRARDALPAGSPDRALVQARIDRLNAPSSGVTVEMPVAVYNEKTGQTTYVPRQQAIGMTPASAAPTVLTPAQLIKRRDTIAEEYKSASNALQVTQDVLDSVTQVKESEGLSRATGFTGTMLPSFPGGQAAFAETRLKNLKGKVTALGKAAAASTGSIGQIANQEWKILADQIAAIEEIKGTEPLLEQIGLLEAQAQGAMRRRQDAYQKQFGEDFERFPQFSTLLEPKSALQRAPQDRGPAAAQAAPSAGNTVTLPDGRVMSFPNAAAAAAFKKAAGL